MRKTLSLVCVALMLVIGLAAAASAASEVTLNGTLVCAKCKLKKAGLTECQDILLVKDDKGATTEYWIAKNDTSKAGHQCSSEAQATVTGTVADKDGQKWVTASKIEKK